jgi:hypothetical protein
LLILLPRVTQVIPQNDLVGLNMALWGFTVVISRRTAGGNPGFVCTHERKMEARWAVALATAWPHQSPEMSARCSRATSPRPGGDPPRRHRLQRQVEFEGVIESGQLGGGDLADPA